MFHWKNEAGLQNGTRNIGYNIYIASNKENTSSTTNINTWSFRFVSLFRHLPTSNYDYNYYFQTSPTL